MLGKLRTLKETTKKNLALFVSGLISLMIFGFWVSGFSRQFGGLFENAKNYSATVYGSFEEKIGNVYNDFNNSIKTSFVKPAPVIESTSTDEALVVSSTTIKSQ